MRDPHPAEDRAGTAPRLADVLAPRLPEWLTARAMDPAVEVVRGAPERLAGLLDWAAIREAAITGSMPLESLRITRGTATIATLLYADRGRADPAKLDSLLDAGVSIIANRVERWHPPCAALAAEVAALIPDLVRMGAIATSGDGGALPLHYDPEDILVVQLAGSKRWLVHAAAVPDPVRGMSPPEPPAGLPPHDFTLAAGDMAFVPAGHWHRCENGPGVSVHVGISLRRTTAADLLCDFAERLRDEPLLRRPISRIAGAAERAAHAAAVRALVDERLAELDLETPVAMTRGRTSAVVRLD